MNKQLILLMLFVSLLMSCTGILRQGTQNISPTQDLPTTDSLWTYADRRAYAMSRTDSTKWNREMLNRDLEFHKSYDFPIKPAISDYPSPVPTYPKWAGCLLAPFKLEIGDKLMQGACAAYLKDKYRELENPNDSYKVKFNILWLTDESDIEMGDSHVLSRNYPHYMSTGKQKTTQGEIDWVQMDMADGTNFAIINQRYFDLNFGKTIVVIPFKDGSLRFLQLNETIDSFSDNPFDEAAKNKIKAFYEELQQNKKVLKILSNPNVIEQKRN